MKSYILKDIRKSKIIVFALWLIYASSYFMRTCYAASIASMAGEGIYDKGEIGLIGTAFFVCYGVGQLISGLIGDKVNPFAMMIFGSIAGALSCFAMAGAGNLLSLIIIWAANGFFQSMLWSPILRVFSETIHKSLQKKAILNISLSLPIGTILAYLASTVIVKYSTWKNVFMCGGAVILLAVLFVVLALIYCKKDFVKVTVNSSATIENGENPKKTTSIWALGALSGLFIIMIPSFLHGMMRDGITNWVPTMITELYGVSPAFSLFLTIVLPIFNAFGAYAAVPVYKKLGENEMKTAGVFAAAALVPLLLMLFSKNLPVYVIVVLLALTTSIMYALNYLIISLVPVHFASCSRTSSVSGILNSAAHIGCAVSSYGFGAVSQKSGWNAVIIVWIAAALLTAAASFLSAGKWTGFIKNN
ncbi:MAG: MFS transporter [Eubacterium sp.]|nr:MFS transporter [Eubacterium sp.]